MTDREAMLAAILEAPHEDTPRLCFADWLDENGESERASFIRTQIELSRWPDTVGKQEERTGLWADLRRRERALLKANYVDWVPNYFGHEQLVHEKGGASCVSFSTMAPASAQYVFARGFIAEVRLSWADWLAHSPALFWRPEMTMECPKCGGHKSMMLEVSLPGYGVQQTKKRVPAPCTMCGGKADIEAGRVVIRDGTGRVPRPFVATCQPLTKITLTTVPYGVPEWQNFTGFIAFDHPTDGKSMNFERVRCATCDGRGHNWPIHGDWTRCPECTGRAPQNLWTCEANWPGLEFVLPTAEPDYTAFANNALRDVARGLSAPLEAVANAFREVGGAANAAAQAILAVWPRDENGELMMPVMDDDEAPINHGQTWRYGAHGLT